LPLLSVTGAIPAYILTSEAVLNLSLCSPIATSQAPVPGKELNSSASGISLDIFSISISKSQIELITVLSCLASVVLSNLCDSSSTLSFERTVAFLIKSMRFSANITAFLPRYLMLL